jgi:trehalose/maltose hydrolase-like predicted phosphorylase
MAIDDPAHVEAAGADAWSLVRVGFDPHVERGVEGAFTVSNGALGVRASIEEGGPASNAMMLIAGVYVPTSAPAAQTLLALGDPSQLVLTIDGRAVGFHLVETLEHRRELDLHAGEMRRSWLFVDGDGRRWRFESARVASAAEPDLYLHRVAIGLVADNAPAELRLRFDGVASETGDGAWKPEGRAARLVSTTNVSGLSAVRTERITSGPIEVDGGAVVARASTGEPIVVESVTRFGGKGAERALVAFADEIEAHRAVWNKRWTECDVLVEGDPALQTGIRFALYHLWSASSVNGGRTSIGARNLSGEAYHGHIFWDTEIFVLPALSLTRPDAARSALLYRYRTLDAARATARALGYRGALYAWESTDTGEERTPPSAMLPDGTMLRILNGEQEHHIAAAIPYAVMQYWAATGDDDFMRDYGDESAIECARFWASRVTPADGHLSIRRVIGPDEFHVGVDNDAYTNAMAAWTLQWAAARAENTKDRSLGVAADGGFAASPAEIREWRDLATRLTGSTFSQDRLYPQFDGYFGLDAVDVEPFRRTRVPIDIALGAGAVQRTRAVKQADVLMAAVLLPHLWTEASLLRNFAYYEPLTAHASSLSPPMHALLAAWLRDSDRCGEYLAQTIAIDLGEGFRAAAGGVHIAALGGLWQAVVFGLAGFKFSRERIEFDPFLPGSLTAIAFGLWWQGRRVRTTIRDNTIEVGIDGPPCTVRVNREVRVVGPELTTTFAFDPALTFWAATQEEGRPDGH